MTGSITLSRHLKLETVEVEAFTAVDAQGEPSYNTFVDVEVRVLRQDKTVVQADGSLLRTELTIWFPPDAALLASRNDRVTWESEKFIAEIVKDVKTRAAKLAHRRVQCRRE